MPAISNSVGVSNCAKCLIPLEDENIKCDRCKSLMHLRCSDLPVYMLLRFRTSQAVYICRACVLGEGDPENLKVQQEKIESTISKEENAIKAGAIESEVNDSKNENKNEDDPIEKDESGKDTLPEVLDQCSNVPDCKFYLRGTCKHGKKGSACSYKHPALCFKFTTKGDLKGGCNKGKDCKYAHPKLCWSLKSGKVCNRHECNFYHVKGTTFKKKNQYQEERAVELNGSEDQTRYDHRRANRSQSGDHRRTNRSQSGDHTAQPAAVFSDNNVNTSPQSSRDFLEIKHQITLIQEQMRFLLGVRMPLPTPPMQMGWGQQTQQK